MAVLSLGFSGTRIGMSFQQKAFFSSFITMHSGFFHHGDCVGADAEAHDLVTACGDLWRVVVHPPVNAELRAMKTGHRVLEPKPYYERNKDIVGQSDYMIFFPKDEKTQGGTWHTINYAMKVGRPFTVCLRNGDLGSSVHKAPPSTRIIKLNGG